MKFVMSFLALSLGLLNNLIANDSSPSPSIIPTKAEQANLLSNVQEVFEQVKLLTEDEALSTNISIVEDIELMVKRAEYILDLLQQITQLRISCDNNSVCSLDAKSTIKQLTLDTKKLLEKCTLQGSDNITVIAAQLRNTTDSALDRGQALLNDLNACSKKTGVSVISCYRSIIKTDVVPVKNVLLGAIEIHRETRSKALDLRKKANLCVDETVDTFKKLLEDVFDDALKCRNK